MSSNNLRPVPKNKSHVCGFCGTTLDVKYAYSVGSSKDFPEPSRATATEIYCCSGCSLERILKKLRSHK